MRRAAVILLLVLLILSRTSGFNAVDLCEAQSSRFDKNACYGSFATKVASSDMVSAVQFCNNIDSDSIQNMCFNRISRHTRSLLPYKAYVSLRPLMFFIVAILFFTLILGALQFVLVDDDDDDDSYYDDDTEAYFEEEATEVAQKIETEDLIRETHGYDIVETETEALKNVKTRLEYQDKLKSLEAKLGELYAYKRSFGYSTDDEAQGDIVFQSLLEKINRLETKKGRIEDMLDSVQTVVYDELGIAHTL